MDFTSLGAVGLTTVLIVKEVFNFLHKNRLCDEIAELTKATNTLITSVSVLAERSNHSA